MSQLLPAGATLEGCDSLWLKEILPSGANALGPLFQKIQTSKNSLGVLGNNNIVLWFLLEEKSHQPEQLNDTPEIKYEEHHGFALHFL